MTGVGTEEKVFCALKKNLLHHLLKSDFLYPTEDSKTRLLLCLDIVYAFILPLCSKEYSATPPNIAYFFSYPTILSSVRTSVINSYRSLISGRIVSFYLSYVALFGNTKESFECPVLINNESNRTPVVSFKGASIEITLMKEHST